MKENEKMIKKKDKEYCIIKIIYFTMFLYIYSILMKYNWKTLKLILFKLNFYFLKYLFFPLLQLNNLNAFECFKVKKWK